MVRLFLSIIIGIALSFFSVSFFNAWETYSQFLIYLEINPLRAITLLIASNFEFDIISFLMSGSFALQNLLTPQLLSWLFVGYISGTIAKGVKRGFLSSFIIIIVDLLVWILLSIVSGEDLMALFQGLQLITTLGGILSALLGGVAGGVAGGFVSGPYQEF